MEMGKKVNIRLMEERKVCGTVGRIWKEIWMSRERKRELR